LSLEFRHIAHSYGSNRALDEINLVAPEGEITCLLGSSGCGKSTLLNLAAGLLAVQQGSIHLGDAVLADRASNPPPERRPVGLVFQDGALFPHMDVAGNVAFGLSGPDRYEASKWIELVGLAGLEDRYPYQLSGGQQQRAALARAMAPGPDVLLMDEPFSSVDIVLRRRLRRDCRSVLRQRATTVIMVTHDPEEALEIGDRIAVMEAGRIAQFGTPEELYTSPASASVGAIFGDAQVIAGSVNGESIATPFGTWSKAGLARAVEGGGDLDLLTRANHFAISAAANGDTALTLRDIRHLGEASQAILVNQDGAELVVDHSGDFALEIGGSYAITPKAGSILAFPS